jgi:hypothetical protein
MNIKSINSSPILPVEPKNKVEGGNVKSHGATDRDADGRRQQAEPELKRHLKQEEFDEALKALSENPGIKANNLQLKVEQREDCRIILIIDGNGAIVRRLSENQLWLATRDKDRQTGRILDKAM